MAACARITDPDSRIRRLIQKLPPVASPMIARFGKGKKAFVILFGGGSGEFGRGHVHVAISRRLPVPLKRNTVAVSEIQAALAPFLGQKATMMISTTFFVPTGDLSSERGIIRPAMTLDTRIGDIVIRQTGAKLEISGGPIDSINWSTRKNGSEIKVELDLFHKAEISDTYLSDCYNLMHSAFRVLALGEMANGG